MLCTGPLSHSEIISIMRHRIRDGSEGELEEVIKEVGCFKQSKKDPNKETRENIIMEKEMMKHPELS